MKRNAQTEKMKPSKAKGQVSLEFLIVLSALVVFLSAFLPIYSQVQAKAREKIVGEVQELAFGQIVALVQQAETLGKQNSLSAKVRFYAENTTFSFDGSAGVLRMSFSNGLKQQELNESLGFPVKTPSAVFGKGVFEVRTEFNNAVELVFSKEA